MNTRQRIGGVSPLKAVRDIFGVTTEQIRSEDRRLHVMKARIYLAWAYDRLGFHIEEIAIFLNRSECSVRRYLKTFQSWYNVDKTFRLGVKNFQSRIKIF